MTADERPLPTLAELEILQILWARGPSTVREIHEEQHRQRRVRYTTVLKLLQNLHDKGLVRRDDTRRSHVYTSAVERGAVESRLVGRFIDDVFEGSAGRLVLRALSTRGADAGELDAVRRLAERLDAEDA